MNDISWIVPYRTEALTAFFSFFRIFAGELVILVSLALGYWILNRRFFRDLAVLISISVLLNLLLKVCFQISRPAVPYLVPIDPSTVFGFPSGDVQVVTVYWLSLAALFMRPMVSFIAVAIILGTACSRMYLGVHSPLDVVGGFFAGSLLVYFFWRYRAQLSWTYKIVAVTYCLLGGLYCLITPSSMDPMSVPLLGLLGGIILGSFLMKCFPCECPNAWGGRLLLAAWVAGSLLLLRSGLRVGVKLWVGESLQGTYTIYFILGWYIIFGALHSFKLLTFPFAKKPQESPCG